MYALINKETVLSGPKDWDRVFFQSILNMNSIEGKRVPVEVPKLPFHINATTKIVKVKINKDDNINPLVQYHRGPLWELSDNLAIANYETVEIALDFAKANYKTTVAAKRYDKEVSGTKITIKNTEVTLDTSREGRNIFVQKYVLMKDGETVNWKFPEGWLTITKAELGTVVSVGESYIQNAFNWEKTLNDSIDAATSIQDLLDLDLN